MPIYAFRCAACGHAFDRLQKLSDPDPAACPACGAGPVRRELTAPSFRLAGSGWYETDFKKDGDRKRNLVEGGEGVKPPAGDGTGGDSKPAGTKPAEVKPGEVKPTPAPASKTETKPEARPKAAG